MTLKEYIYNTIPTDRFITRQELVNIVGISDRAIRNIISDIRKEHTIISLSSNKGYRKCKSTDDMTNDEIKLEYDIMKHAINENNSRIKEIKKNMRSQIARFKILERNINE